MLRKTTILYLTGEIVSKAIPFLLMPYLTRSLGVDAFGYLAVYQAWMAFAVVFISYVQDAALIRYIYFYGHRSVGLIIIVGRCYSTIVFLVGAFFAYFIGSEFLFLVVVCSYSQSLLKVELTLQQGLKKPMNYLYILIFSNLIVVFFTVISFELIEANVINRILAITFGNLFCIFIAFTFFNQRNFYLFWSKRQLKLASYYILGFSSPLVFNSLATICKGQFDRLLIAEKFSVSELGEYAAGYQIASILLLLLLAISRALEPYCYELLKRGDLNVKIILIKVIYLLPFLSLPALIAQLIPDDFYVWFLGEEFNNVKLYVVQFVIAFSILGVYMIFSLYLNFFGKTKQIAFLNSVSITIYLFSLFTFSKFGMEYIGFATILSNFVLTVLAIYYCHKLKINLIK
ncbi:oligosaccharide flippase family protein [Vibrio metoecus]|uniref:oligosaccharide flippase family protein n=1 Tax=Vibrio metoecus TaxID=1481663 RepID=UPI00300C1F49